jgi:hypothetical protein
MLPSHVRRRFAHRTDRLLPAAITTIAITVCLLTLLHLLIAYLDSSDLEQVQSQHNLSNNHHHLNNQQYNTADQQDDDIASNTTDSMYSTMCDAHAAAQQYTPLFVSQRLQAGQVTPVDIAIVTLFTLNLKPRMKIRERHTLVSYPPAYGADVIEQARLSLENKLQYSHVHAYPLFYYHAALATTSRPATWSKIPVLQRYLQVYHWVLWIDLDAHIMDMHRVLESLIPDPVHEASIDLVITKDWYGLNNGVFLLRRSEWSRRFLQQTWDGYHTYNMQDATFAEQSVMERVISEMGARQEAQHVKYVQRTLINAYSSSVNPPQHITLPSNFGRYHYEPGDFILHMPGLHPHERIKDLRRYKQPNVAINHRANVTKASEINWRIEVLDYQMPPPPNT